MVSKNTDLVTNGSVLRRCPSWIESFTEYTSKIGSPEIYRKWVGIAAIAGILQQKVWLNTAAGILYPNVYVFLVGGPGMGKSITINSAQRLCREVLPAECFGATSMTMASMTDIMVEAKRIIPVMPPPALEYNSLFIFADELSAFMNDWKGQSDLVAGLSKFYDCSPYSQGRRTGTIRIAIERPQLNILTGTTPSNLIKFIPDWAWDQGFTSRVMIVFSSNKQSIKILGPRLQADANNLIHDLKVVDSLCGEFGWSTEFSEAVDKWQEAKFEPQPTHPKLAWYNERRRAHLLKLSMIACVNRSNDLQISIQDYKTALAWMIEAEHYMPDVFRLGQATDDSKAIDEIYHFIASQANGVAEHRIKNFAIGRIPAQWILQTLNVMEGSGLIKAIGVDKFGQKTFKAIDRPH